MSTLTKVFVVVLFVLVLIASAVFITMATVPQNYKDLYQQEEARADQAALYAKNAELLRQISTAEAQAAKASEQTLRSRMSQRVGELQAELEAERLALRDVQAQFTSLNAKLTKLQTAYDAYLERYNLLEEQRDRALSQVAELGEEIRQTQELLRQVRGQYERVEQVARLQAEQVAERDERIQELQQQLASGGAAPAGDGQVDRPSIPADGMDVTGTIEVVRNDLAQINVGSAKGIESGMRLIIYRGSQFVGYLRVAEVNVNSAAGFIVDQRLEPRKGDKVTTALQVD